MHLLIEPQFQPILDAHGQCYAREVLFRFNGEESLPENLFKHWERTGFIAQVDMAVLRRLGAMLKGRNFQGRLAVNVSARTLEDCSQAYLDALLELATIVPRVIVEITETYAIRNVNAVAAFSRICHLNRIYVGLDDCAPGHQFCDPEFITRVKPAFMKIDAGVIAEAEDRNDASDLRAIVAAATHIGARTIGEGIDNPEKLDLILRTGVTMWQGFLGGKPMRFQQSRASVALVA